MSSWLPPGCTDKDIDDAINGDGSEEQCDCCGKMFPVEHLRFIRHDHPNSNAPCDTTVCSDCGRDSDEATFKRLKEYIEFHRRNLLPVDSLREAIERYKECGE